ncbi:PX domain-containing protein EREX-like isoform X1 [Cynara cardunculus var. scolymus]|uniref:PX domain-containing protein EREX-like isoform X1 n=1 Tax=Cynara cardunculus var. scolymus TaxID=59895 RepID=UPI000D6260C2|nr:PX domain-containing protein EREX-like isoform X1 [Cynara cardunculus var. scolymus]
MSMYGYDVSFYDYGFSDPAITSSLYGNSLSPMAAAMDYDDGVYVRRRPPTRLGPSSKNPSSPPKHRHDGTSPLPLGMDWSLPPRIWEGRNSVWPHDSRRGWSYCVTVPSWTIVSSAGGSDTVFFRVQVGILSPEGTTTTRGVLRRFNDFLTLHSELRKEFPKKNLPPAPPRRLMKMRSSTLLEERRCALEVWVEKLFSDIDVSRTALVAIFLELEAAARQSCCELLEEESAANLVSSNQFPSNSGISSSSSISSDLRAPRPEKENYAEPNIDNASERENFRDNSSVNTFDGLREDFAEGKHDISNQHKILYRKSDTTIDGYHDDGGVLETSGLDSDFGGHASESSDKSIGKDVSSIRACETCNSGLGSSVGDSSLQGLQGDLVVALPSEERHKVNRVLTTVQQRLGTTKMDMEDLVVRLNQEIVAREYLTTKVKELEMELETRSQSSKENAQQAISTERERSTHLQWDMEELRRKCMEFELKLTTEQDARAYAESMKATAIQQNELLIKELDEAREQAEILRKQQDEVELKSKSDLKILVKEVKSLRTSHSELKQELSKCLEEKVELEKEKQRWESGNAIKTALLHECELLHDRLRECSVNFLFDEENKLIMDTSLSDAINLLETSDSQINLLLAEAQLLVAEDVKTTTGAADENDIQINRDDELRRLIGDILADNAKLRKQVISVIHTQLAIKDNGEDDDASIKTSPSNYP